MRLGKFTKTPDEILRYKIEYSHWLDSNEYVSSIEFETVSTNAGALTLIADNIGASSTSVTFLASGGNDGETYEVSATMATTGNQIKQDVIFFTVKAIEVAV